ncbi:endolytic transglycosylase MltG [Pseudoroseicyclus tamaricis]|uniref:Endolytic murein transglycosylase n=1 Tax=Pseudoroseicyclus tamaricis TaxID=2705421 RepID=A0A6B2JRM2_9RHOB|nr:endolytic transglycosylase MltG [Pseudoroseicyclus tamaricis]NDV00838.1 endolytic transglycosylase MltG [Pseudoroseicyclus tamaricis]
MWKAIASNALTLFIVILFLVAGVISWGAKQYRDEGPLETAICLRVPSGSNMRLVSEDLAGQGAITSASIYRIGADYTELEDQLKAGAFLIPAGATMEEILDIVTRGGQSTCGTEIVYRVGLTGLLAEVRELDPETNRFEELVEWDPAVEPEAPEDYTRVREAADTRYRVVLPEGLTSWQVVQGLNAVEILAEPVEDIPPEGMLAPDSYEVQPGTTVASILQRMQSAQAAILAAAWAEREEGLPLASPEEALILASIVEKETGLAEERPLVASVFENRLIQGMRLQTDPTVIYGVTEGRGVLGRGLRQSELRGETPYNTYVIDGLPPTPIANPGRASIQATLNPADSDYIFFVADGTGGHAFAETLAEHNENVARWRQIEAEAAE